MESLVVAVSNTFCGVQNGYTSKAGPCGVVVL